MSAERPLVQAHALGQVHGGRAVLESVSFELRAGERLAVLGPSGAGKTTLLRLLAGLDAPASGTIAIGGKTVSGNGRVVTPPEDRGVALVFQGLALFPHMRASAQVELAVRGKNRGQVAAGLLDRVGLGKRLGAYPHELSGGERQRLALARALAQEPRVLLLDEPFGELDPDKRGEIRDLVRALLDRSRTTLVLVTHAREDVFALARRVLVLENGRSVAEGEIEALVREPRTSQVVRALELGSILEGEVVGEGEVATAAGRARAALGPRKGKLPVLVRPDQARILGEDELGGVAGEVEHVALVAPEARSLRHVASVRVGEAIVRARAATPVPRPGTRVRLALEGEVVPLDR